MYCFWNVILVLHTYKCTQVQFIYTYTHTHKHICITMSYVGGNKKRWKSVFWNLIFNSCIRLIYLDAFKEFTIVVYTDCVIFGSYMMQWIFLFVCKHRSFVRIKLLEVELLIESERRFLKGLTRSVKFYSRKWLAIHIPINNVWNHQFSYPRYDYFKN